MCGYGFADCPPVDVTYSTVYAIRAYMPDVVDMALCIICSLQPEEYYYKFLNKIKRKIFVPGTPQIIDYFPQIDCVLRMEINMAKKVNDLLWHDRKRWTFFGLPFTFTRYSVNKERLFISKGFLNVNDDEVRLYRIMDISLKRTLTQRIFGLGTIRICSGDKTMKDFEIVNIKKPVETKEFISDLVERQRDAKRVVNRENMVDHSHFAGHGIDADDLFDDDSPFDREED